MSKMIIITFFSIVFIFFLGDMSQKFTGDNFLTEKDERYDILLEEKNKECKQKDRETEQFEISGISSSYVYENNINTERRGGFVVVAGTGGGIGPRLNGSGKEVKVISFYIEEDGIKVPKKIIADDYNVMISNEDSIKINTDYNAVIHNEVVGCHGSKSIDKTIYLKQESFEKITR